MSPLAERAAAWLLAYAIHSTLLLGAAAVITARLRDHGWRDTLWRAALVGGVVTVGAQAALGYNPAAGGWSPAAPFHASADLAPSAPADLAPATPGADAAPSIPRPAAIPAAGGQGDVARPAASAASPWWPAADWRNALLAAWAAGALLLLARLAFRQASLHRMLGARTPAADAALTDALAALCRAAGVARVPRLTESARCPTPLALGMGEICVPARFRELPAEERRAALAHELAHVARRDPLWYLAAGIAEALFFFQPLHRLARKRLRESAEYLADDWAVRQTGSPLGLARCLVEVAMWLKGADPVPQGVLAMAEGGPVLSRRIERLVAQRDPAAPVRPGWRVAAALLLLAPVAALAPGAGPRAAAAATARQDGRIVRHPDPSRPLAERVRWAMGEARGRRAWFGWAAPAVANEGNATVHDTHGLNVDELGRTPIGERLGARAGEAVILFRVDASGRIERITTRLGRVGMELGGIPVYWLGAAPAPESLEWLEARSRAEGVPRLRAGLVEAMGTHAGSARVVPLLSAALARDPSWEVRGAAAEALARHPGDEALRLLLVAVEGDRDQSVRLQATEAVGHMDLPEARRQIRRLVREAADAEVRREAVESISDRPGPGALTELESLVFQRQDAAVQLEATESLENLPAAQSLPALVRIAWTHPRADVRREAAETLGNLPHQAGLAALDSILAGHPDEDVQRQAVEALANLPAQVSLPRLRRLASSHPSEAVRMQAREQLESRRAR
jgi:HEAT repeat protein